MTHLQQVEDQIIGFLQDCDKSSILSLIHEKGKKENLFKNVEVYHMLVRVLAEDESRWKDVTQLIYLLTLHGADINLQDQDGNTAMLQYIQEAEHPSIAVLQAFLRCGSDGTLKNKSGEDVLEYMLHADHLPRQVKALVLDYMPGIWRAVEVDDAMSVRRLINQWCSIHVEKDDMTVLQLAFNKGTENIIRVISGIASSMDLVHAVLAGDVRSVKTILNSGGKYNINLKNMADRGATPLFYALCENDVSMVDLLIEHGARLDIGMQGEGEMEIPLYFAALTDDQCIDTELLQHIVPVKPTSVDCLLYKGRNVIFYCIENDVEISLFEAILRKCSAYVLTQNVQQFKESIDARTYAEKLIKKEYTAVIDKVVGEWCTDDGCHDNRNILALHGYPFTPSLCWNVSSPVDHSETFLQMLPEYEEHKSKLTQAVKDGDLITVKEMLYSESWASKGLNGYFCFSRMRGDGQPLLHKAVLRKHIDVVREIAQCLIYKCKMKLDVVKDQYFRTAYHYANGMEDGKELVFMLEDLGMSEFAMDKDGRSPLAFKDRKSQKEMKALILFQTLQDFRREEPDPWSTPLQLPIVGYLAKCAHEHNSKKSASHTISSTSSGKKKVPQESGNEQMYTKVDPGDYYGTNHLFSANNKSASSIQENGAIINNKEHYQILDTTGTRYTQDDYSQNNYNDDETDSPESKPSKIETPSDNDSYEVSKRDDDDQVVSDFSDDERSDLEDEQSELDHESSEDVDENEQEENYDGDYSDMESDDERDKEKFASYCVIL